MKLSRRQFLKSTLAASALVGAGGMGTLLTPRTAHAAANSPQLTKWTWEMRRLGDIPLLNSVDDPVFPNTKFYQITVGEFTDWLHPQLSPTRLWGYRETDTPVTAQRHLGGIEDVANP